jgi:tripartite-type tricarboxylate transporter receptor subunit TctC
MHVVVAERYVRQHGAEADRSPLRWRTRARIAVCGSVAAVLTAGALASPASAQAFPTKPIRLILPFPPGGATDLLGRIVSQAYGEQLGQPVLADNRPGAGGYLGLELASRARPDGYTMVIASLVLVSGPSLYPKLAFNPQRDLMPITQLTQSPNAVLVHPSSPAKSLRELLDLARASPGKLNYASSGAGSPLHLSAELLKSVTKTDFVHVAYKGSGPALAGLVGGEVQMMVMGAAALPQIRAGKARALAVLGNERWGELPDVPTAQEVGVKDVVVPSWHGLLAPAGTSRPLVNRLNAAWGKVASAPEARATLQKAGFEPVSGTPEQFGKLIAAETQRWARVIKEANISGEQ